MTPHNLNILLGLSTVGFVVVSLLYMIHLHDTKWKLLSKDNKIRHLESELRHYSSLYFSGCACKKNHAHTKEAESKPNENNPIQKLWEYIPPYTTPNHPPHIEVITTTNTGDTPMTEEDPDLLAGDNLDRLRGRNLTEELENARYQNNLLTEECRELEKERDEARRYSCDLEARIIVLEEDRRDTSNKFGTNPCSEIILPDYPLAREPKEIAKQKGWDCFKDNA